MAKRKAISLALTLALFTTGAQAQSTLGELLDKGFKKMTKGEFVTAVSGAKISAVRADGVELEYGFNADGSIAGKWYSTRAMGDNLGQGTFSGTWSVDDDGKVCTITMSRGGQTNACGFWFRNGDEYYSSGSASDRDAAAGKRVFKK